MPNSSTIKIVDIVTPTTGKPKTFLFNIDNTTDCFCFYVTGTSRDEQYAIQLKDSKNKTLPEFADENMYNESISSDNFISNKGVIEFSLPIKTGQNVTIPGQWTGEIKYDPNQGVPTIKVAQRTTIPGQGSNKFSLPVNLVLYCSNNNQDRKKKWIKDALVDVKRVFGKAAINCVFGELQVLPLPTGEIIDSFWSDPATKSIVAANGKTDQLTVIFIEGLKVAHFNQAGKSGGIPGPQGFTNRFAAVLVRITNDPNDPIIVNKSFLGFTIAHEMGHYLGLTHESSGNDNTNLMYSKLGRHSNGSLNDSQKYILQQMPLVQINYGNVQKTPVTQLEITVTTGTTWPTWTDGPGTDMNIGLDLGSDNNGYRSWDLNAWGNDFESGSVNVFQLTDVKNLYMEDIDTWKIYCSWSYVMYSPINLLMLKDDWNFKHLKIKANGQVIYDADVNVIMSLITDKRFIVKKFK